MNLMEEIAAKTLPPGTGYEWTAMSYQEKVVGGQIYVAFGLALLLVYLVLAGQYESWYAPISVILSVPLSFIGPVLALSALTESGLNNNLYVQIGLVLLMALSAKNAILIVEFARELRAAGRPILDAATEAARARFRPIVMTSLAFILGVVPLVLASGAGASARVSIGMTVFTGMIASTCLAVLFVPPFFAVLQRFWNLLTQRQSQFGRRDSYGIAGFQYSKIAMARFALRVTTASALICAAMTGVGPTLRPAWAQETERPFGLFGIFNGSERMGGSAP